MKNPNSSDAAPNGPAPSSVSARRAAPGAHEECSNCGTKKGWILHNVRHLSSLRRLCTSCVLRLHPSSFCPFCFLSHPDQITQNTLVSCSKCPSLSHPDCLPPYAAFSPSPFLCPPCASANPAAFSFFHLDDRRRSLDKRLAAVLLCAATIAHSSMSKAAALARADAERHVREAATARKRARDALDRFVILSSSSAKAVRAAANVLASSNGGGKENNNANSSEL